jgi:hypothetical protein
MKTCPKVKMLEIEIVDPEEVTLSDGSVEITLVPGGDDIESKFEDNLAEKLDEDELGSISFDDYGLGRR